MIKLGGIILSGGKSSRFGSDKGLFMLNGLALVEYSIQVARLLTNDITIITQNPDYKKFGVKNIPDIFQDTGPMGGIHSGLFHSSFDINLILSCDTPFLNKAIADLLIKNYSNQDVVIFKTSDAKYHPLTGLYHKRVLPLLESNLQQGKFKLIDTIFQTNYKVISLKQDENLDTCFSNFNTPNDLKSSAIHL
jgi:molybdopterin-guanine dinucleotide biosynthesis protein A